MLLPNAHGASSLRLLLSLSYTPFFLWVAIFLLPPSCILFERVSNCFALDSAQLFNLFSALSSSFWPYAPSQTALLDCMFRTRISKPQRPIFRPTWFFVGLEVPPPRLPMWAMLAAEPIHSVSLFLNPQTVCHKIFSRGSAVQLFS